MRVCTSRGEVPTICLLIAATSLRFVYADACGVQHQQGMMCSSSLQLFSVCLQNRKPPHQMGKCGLLHVFVSGFLMIRSYTSCSLATGREETTYGELSWCKILFRSANQSKVTVQILNVTSCLCWRGSIMSTEVKAPGENEHITLMEKAKKKVLLRVESPC